MRSRTFVRVCLILVMVLVQIQKLSGIPHSESDINSDTSTTQIGSSSERMGQLVMQLAETTLTNPLQVLLQVLNKQPQGPTLKLIRRIINNIINGGSITKALHVKLLNELQKHSELRRSLADVNLNAANTEKPMQLKVFPAELRHETITEVLKFNNLTQLITESVTENDSIAGSVNDNPTTSCTLLPPCISDEQGSGPPLNHSVNSTLESVDTKTISDNLQKHSEISSIDSAKVTANQQTITPVIIRKIIDHILDKQTETKKFPSLSEELLKILSQYNLKYFSTYSEILEPLSLREIKENKNKNEKSKGNWKEQKCLLIAKQKTKKLNNNPKKVRNTPNSADKNISQQNKCDSANNPITSELFKEATKEEISSVKSTLVSSTDLVGVTSDRRLADLATTRKPNRPPGRAFELSSLYTLPTLSTVSDTSYTEF